MNAPFKLTASLAFTFVLAGFVRAADIDGKWNAEFETQVGQQRLLLELKADREKLTGQASADRGAQFGKTATVITDGKIVKDEVSFTESVRIQGQDIKIEYKG